MSDLHKEPLEIEIREGDHREETHHKGIQLEEDHQEGTHHKEVHQPKGIRTMKNEEIESTLERSVAISTSSTKTERRPKNSRWNLA